VLIRWCTKRSMTAKGFVFVTLEDETGFANGILTPPVFEAHRAVLVRSPFLCLSGRLQNQDGVVSVKVSKVQAVDAPKVPGASHDFY